MQNSRLIATFRTLNKTEWRSLHKYLLSPFFNQREDVVALAIFIQKELAKSAGTQSLEKAIAWKKVYPKQQYDDKQLRYTMSYLLELVESFLAQLDMQSENPFHQLFIFNALRKRGLEKNGLPHLIAAQSANQSNDRYDPALNRILQRHIRELMPLTGEVSPPNTRQETAGFTSELLMETIREGCAFLDSKNLHPDDKDFPWLDTALDFCEKEQWSEKSDGVAMLYHTYRMLETMQSGGGESHFEKVKSILNNATSIPPALQRESWLRAINFAIRQQNFGNKIYGKAAFELYKAGIQNGLILENGQISKKAYSNTLILALVVGEWDWAEVFLKEYKEYLPENERDNTYRLNLATLFFKQKQFGKVLETLQNVAFIDSAHNLDGRRLLLCSYYELGEWASLDSLLDSFGIWLRRAKNLGYLRELYANLVKFTRRLVDVQHQNQAIKEKLKQEILSVKNVAAKEWLLEKL